MRDDNVSAEKARIRAEVRDARRAIAPEARAHAAAALADTLASVPALARARVVLGYGANAEEIDPEPTLVRLREAGVLVAYPRVAGDELEARAVREAAELAAGSFGIREPLSSAPLVELDRIDAVLVPGVAFDRAGYRLGYGGGFYDRFLPRLRATAMRIGLAFEEQVVDELPRESHDAPLDFVVTPSSVLRTGRRPTS